MQTPDPAGISGVCGVVSVPDGFSDTIVWLIFLRFVPFEVLMGCPPISLVPLEINIVWGRAFLGCFQPAGSCNMDKKHHKKSQILSIKSDPVH
jgi:hypothetical protein